MCKQSRGVLCSTLVGVLMASSARIVFSADIPPLGPKATTTAEKTMPAYFWQTVPAKGGAEIVTLFCRRCRLLDTLGRQSEAPVPLISVLRDTLGDNSAENDHLRYVWLLTYAKPNVGQRILSAVPFFYWRVGEGAKTSADPGVSPLIDVSEPRRPVISEIGRNIVQWGLLDPLSMPIRASSRAYRTNSMDHERLHLEEAISYLREAPVANDRASLSGTERNTIIARLTLRKRLLGGLVSERRAEEIGKDDGFNEERVRSRNWEVLRQCAEKTGLLFEPISIAGANGQYAVLWYPLRESFNDPGTSLEAAWKVLSIKNPWKDDRIQHWQGPRFLRDFGGNGTLLPEGLKGVRQSELAPLGVYSMTYPKSPILLVDFRDGDNVRRREITQRTIDEVTTGVLGLSHFTNWYFYAGQTAYNFVRSRRGAAMDRVERLDCYSEFRVALSMDRQLNPELRNDIAKRINSLAVNPLETSPAREIEMAQARYERLKVESQSEGKLAARLDNDRRAELAEFGRTDGKQFMDGLLHDAALGSYTRRVKRDASNLADVDRIRRVQFDLNRLDALVEAGTAPEIANDTTRLHVTVTELTQLLPLISAADIRHHALTTLRRLKDLSQDASLHSAYELASDEISKGAEVAPDAVITSASAASARLP